jgi:hypothetical protein
MPNRYFLPIYFECPRCHQPVQVRNIEPPEVCCDCIAIDYDHALDILNLRPDSTLARMRKGAPDDWPRIAEHASFAWGQLVSRRLGEQS